MHPLLVTAWICAQGPLPFTWAAPVDFGASCVGQHLHPPLVCLQGAIARLCDDVRLGARRREDELCNDACACAFGSTCVQSASMRFCLKVCFSERDCVVGQACHRFWGSSVSACVSSSMEAWLRPRDFRPDPRERWLPGARWLEPARFRPADARELIRTVTRVRDDP